MMKLEPNVYSELFIAMLFVPIQLIHLEQWLNLPQTRVVALQAYE